MKQYQGDSLIGVLWIIAATLEKGNNTATALSISFSLTGLLFLLSALYKKVTAETLK